MGQKCPNTRCIRVTMDEVFLRKRWKFVLVTDSWKAMSLIETYWNAGGASTGKIGSTQFDSNKVYHKLWSKRMPWIKHNFVYSRINRAHHHSITIILGSGFLALCSKASTISLTDCICNWKSATTRLCACWASWYSLSSYTAQRAQWS